jgi:hypothetical protein
MEIAMQAERTLDMLPKLDDPKKCLERAVRCEKLAKKSGQRGMLLELAGRWRGMAQELETQSAGLKSSQSNQI